MKRTRQISIVPPIKFVESTIPTAQSKINTLRFNGGKTEVTIADIEEILKPVYTELARMMSGYFGAAVVWEELRGFSMTSDFIHGRLIVCVERLKLGVSEHFDIELIPLHTEDNLVDLRVASSNTKGEPFSPAVDQYRDVSSLL